MYKSLFSDELLPGSSMTPLEKGYIGPNGEGILEDPFSTYSLNSQGYRSKEFIKNEELVIAGCSFSFGIGISEEMIWGTQVAKHFNLSYSNLSIPGISPSQMVYNLFAYFKKYGNPKYLIVLSPDYFRLGIPSVMGKFVSEKYENSVIGEEIRFEASHLYFNIESNEVIKYSKSPHIIENIVPIEVPTWLNAKHLQILEQYCDQANIKLIWSFWDRVSLNRTYIELINNPNLFKYLIDSGVREWDKDKLNNDVYLKKCHEHLRELYPNTFDIGGDIMTDRFRAHFGVHKHTHIAENFIKHIENNWDI